MQAIILAAGQGIRMRPLTDKICKPMLKIKDRPILEYTLSNLPDEISEIVIIVGYKAELIKNYFGSSYKGKKLQYFFQEKLDGSAGAIYQAQKIIKNKFIVLNGDDLYHHDDIKNHLSDDFWILTKEVDEPGRFGVLEINSQGNLLEIAEKPKNPKNNLVNIGIYGLNKKIFDYPPVPLSNKKEFGLPQTLAKIAKDYEVKIKKADFWQPIGYPEDLKKAEEIIHQFSSRLDN